MFRPDHWAEMLSVEVQQVNEGRRVGEYLRGLSSGVDSGLNLDA